MKTIFQYIVGTLILLMLIVFLHFVFESESARLIMRLFIACIFWAVVFYGMFFHKEDPPTIDIGIFEMPVKILVMLFWTIVLYFFAIHGIGMEGGPWEDV